MKWGWVDVDEVVETLASRPGDERVVITGRGHNCAAGHGGRPGRGDDQGEAPDGRRTEGPGGHRMVNLPRVVVSAPAWARARRPWPPGSWPRCGPAGWTSRPHAGPDYIDPGYHALATGRPGRNLDPVLCGEELIAPLFAHGAAGADMAVVEGVMGLFDGRGRTSFGSTAHVARLLDAPVLLVVDAAAQGRSVAALVAGFGELGPASARGRGDPEPGRLGMARGDPPRRPGRPGGPGAGRVGAHRRGGCRAVPAPGPGPGGGTGGPGAAGAGPAGRGGRRGGGPGCRAEAGRLGRAAVYDALVAGSGSRWPEPHRHHSPRS